MIVKTNVSPSKCEIQQNSNAVRNTWSREERTKRRRIAIVRQQRLLSVLFSRPMKIPA